MHGNAAKVHGSNTQATAQLHLTAEPRLPDPSTRDHIDNDDDDVDEHHSTELGHCACSHHTLLPLPGEKGGSQHVTLSRPLATSPAHIPSTFVHSVTVHPLSPPTVHAPSPRSTTPIMSARKLGGGRIIGNGKGLAPPQPQSRPSKPRARDTSPYAPSDASSTDHYSTSQNSISPPSSSTPIADFGPQDLASRISIGGPSDADASSPRLVCPICDDEMVGTSPLPQPDLAHFRNSAELPVCTADAAPTQPPHR